MTSKSKVGEKKAIVTMYLEVPSIPNFLRISGTSQTISIKEVPEKELRKIGKAWVDGLVAKSNKNIL